MQTYLCSAYSYKNNARTKNKALMGLGLKIPNLLKKHVILSFRLKSLYQYRIVVHLFTNISLTENSGNRLSTGQTSREKPYEILANAP